MSDLPYSTAVLRLAAEANGAGRLAPPRRSHTENNPVCGDRVTVDLRLVGPVVEAMAHDTKACVLTQASASLLSAALLGSTEAQLTTARAAVAAMLLGGPAPDGAYSGYAVLAEVARHPARHRCVLLPLDAALKALS
ncbi:MAG: iron-sulfur cluster assembly scaffold protein [Rhizomicrobium sp.]|nr:iron-sulfur cluster assembly scaffold protein [Rhizomicrobium sp.]